MIPPDSDNEALLSRVSKAANGTDTAYKDMVLRQVESELMGDPLAPPDSGGVLADELDSICNGLAFANRDTATMRQAAAALRALSRALALTEQNSGPTAMVDEILQADAAPPEASFDNAKDMLDYLNAPSPSAEQQMLEKQFAGRTSPKGSSVEDHTFAEPSPDKTGGGK